jgi:hypothetical protein
MDPTLLASIVAAVSAVAAAASALIAVPFTARAANAARAQTQLQRELAQAQAQPYVWADIQPDMKQGTLLQVVVANSGPTMAQNVQVIIDPPLQPEAQFPGAVEAAQRRLAEGIRSLAPGRRIEWSAGRGFDVLGDDAPHVHKITVTADGPHGPITPLVFEVNLSDWREGRDAPDGSLHLVRTSITDLTKELKMAGERAARASQPPRVLEPRTVDGTTHSDGIVILQPVDERSDS